MPKTNRWDCLKPESSSTEENNTRVNRFKAPNRAPTNSRWKRSKSPEVKINTFKTRRRGNYQGGRFRNNRRGRRGPSIFDNAKRDNNGRPILKGSITQGFDITSAIKSTSSKQTNKERRKQKEAQKKKEKEEAERQRKLDEEKATKELQDFKADSEWNKAMMERFMYEEESSSEDESEED
tara:strand:+ start:43 stop:582 length:540 start_codon:yes stop_codon:yes gene_type:complete